MKKKLIVLTCLLGLQANYSQAQSLNGPESVEYDDVNQRWLISNNGSGEILQRAQDGTLSVFASGISSGPHGLEIVGTSVFACDGSNLKEYSLSGGVLLNNVNLGATFLNGITHDNNGNLFITDFSAKKIYRYTISSGQFNVYVTGLAKSPNGIIFDEDDNRLVFVNWGANAPVMAVQLSDSTVSTLTATTLGNCDGIAMNCQNQFYVSSWSPNRISRFENDFVAAPVNMNVSGLSSPADIYFAQTLDTLGVPNSGNNTVGLHPFASCLNVGISTEDMEHPLFSAQLLSSTSLLISMTNNDSKMKSIEIVDLSGRMIFQKSTSSSQETIQLHSGLYFVHVTTGDHHQVKKIMIP